MIGIHTGRSCNKQNIPFLSETDGLPRGSQTVSALPVLLPKPEHSSISSPGSCYNPKPPCRGTQRKEPPSISITPAGKSLRAEVWCPRLEPSRAEMKSKPYPQHLFMLSMMRRAVCILPSWLQQIRETDLVAQGWVVSEGSCLLQHHITQCPNWVLQLLGDY